MLKFALCDDEPEQLAVTQKLLAEYLVDRPALDICPYAFLSAQSLLNQIDMSGGFSLYILDILMPELNGIQLGMEIRKRDEEAVIIYLTTTTDYAVESYTIRAFHYMVKPVEKRRLFQVLDEAVSLLDARSYSHQVVKTKDGIMRLTFSTILYAELYGRCIRYHLTDRESVTGIAVRGSFREAVNRLLEDHRFVLTSASHAVNLQHVRSVEKSALVLTNGLKVPVSRKLQLQVKNCWLDYWLAGEDRLGL